MLKWSPFTDTERMDWHIDKMSRTSRNIRGKEGKKHLYTRKINKEKLGPRQFYCTDVSIGCDRLLSFSSSVYLQSSALHMIKFQYSTVRHGIFTNSRLHHLQCYKQTQNITQWLASTVVPFQCLFIVRQDTAELFKSCHWGVKQVVRLPCQWSCIKWTPLLLSVLWIGRCKVA